MKDDTRFSREQMNRLLRPRSIAVVGASPGSAGLGARVLANLVECQFPGELYPVNPKYPAIAGRPCLSSPDELPEGVDCAVLAIPRAGVLNALEACARRGVGAAIVFSAGYAESGEAGRAEQERVSEIARRSGMIVEGPNCLGMVNAIDGTPLTFVVSKPEKPRPGRTLALISQSGALAAVLGVSLRERGLDVSFSISSGNEAVAGVEDFLEFMIEDPNATVIVLVVEQFREPMRFLALAARAGALGKRLALLHPGSSSAARVSAATHTGAMAGDYEVMRTKVRQAGVLMVRTLEELIDVTEILVRCPTLPRAGTAVFTESGFFKALALDLCEELGVPLPPLADATHEALRQALPDFIPPSNPLDVTAQGLVDPGLYRRTLPPVLADERYGCVVLSIILSEAETAGLKIPPIIAALTEIRAEKPVLFACMDEGAPVPPAYIEQLRDAGAPYFPSAERAFRALAAVSKLQGEPDCEERARIEPVIVQPGVTPEYQAKQILARVGIPVPAGGLARSVEEAQAIATKTGYPVALKAQAAALSHKSDAGGVVLKVQDAEALAEAWRRMHDVLSRAMPGLALDGALVEQMSPPGVELIAGARRDPDWGPVLLVGFGGVLAEAFGDVRLLPAEISREGIAQELLRMKSGALLRGLRGSPAMDVAAAADIVARLADLVLSTPSILEVDINPVMVYPSGEGALALDALIVAG
ncbi:MAG: acetate--CoA ligase family protein [Candidatus Solibacter sp.]